MKDEKTLAYINFYAVLGALSELCRLDRGARELLGDKTISLGIAVKDGPCGTLVFSGGACSVKDGAGECDIRLPFSSCAKFNGMIDGIVTPFPSKGLTKIKFLTKTFTKLTDILTKYLRATEADLENPEFFRVSTLLMFYTITEAVSQIANHDKIGKASASYIVDGTAKLAIGEEIGAGITAFNHQLKTEHEIPEKFLSYMIFNDIKLARNLFDGKINSVAAVGSGLIRIGGMVSQIDNLNRILDRVSVYLA